MFLDQQNDLVILECDNDLQFLNMRLNLDEPKVNDNSHNNFQLQISNCNLLLVENNHNHLNDKLTFYLFQSKILTIIIKSNQTADLISFKPLVDLLKSLTECLFIPPICGVAINLPSVL